MLWHVLITLESKNNNIFPKYRFAVVRGFKNLKVVCPYHTRGINLDLPPSPVPKRKLIQKL